jgi:hypothetical protein
MGVTSTQGLSFQLVANDISLDLFKDEEIKVSDNVTGLFDIGQLPSEFTRTITLPGTKKNNAFFEHVYDISVTNPFLFSTNTKVDAYFDFGGIYVSSGYLQLNKVNVIANKFIDSYEVTIYGSLSSFAREINRATLNDLTTLSQYDHSSSFQNITASWDGDLFNGDIVYPLADYGQNIGYDYSQNSFGINTDSGSLSIQDFKPSIRVHKVWDAIFEQYGYTYESEFLDSGVWDDVYMVCDNNLRYPNFDGVDLEGFGVFEATPLSGSDTDITMTNGVFIDLDYDNITNNPQFVYQTGSYNQPLPTTKLDGRIKLNVQVSGSTGFPQFTLRMTNGVSNYDYDLEQTNTFFREVESQSSGTGDKKYELEERFSLEIPTSGEFEFKLKYDNYEGSTFTVINNPEANTNGYIAVDKSLNAGDWRVMRIAPNLPYGENGIKQIDFIKGLQKKFNLIIYPSKTKPRHFVVQTFNNWYKQGEIKSFNNFIDLNKKIEVIPANNLAVRNLNFGDRLGKDYLAQQFDKEVNREFGKVEYVDTQNFFSQGTLDVETTFSSSPLRYLQGTGVSGSAAPAEGVAITIPISTSPTAVCTTTFEPTLYIETGAIFPAIGDILYTDPYLTNPLTGYSYTVEPGGDVRTIDSSTGEYLGAFVRSCYSQSG